MTTLNDTPTQTTLASKAGGVSIKIEQGVFCENNECEGSKINTEFCDIPKFIKHESNYPPVTENVWNGMGDDNSNVFNITHSIFQPDFEIKIEPGVDIDDRHPEQAEPLAEFDLQSSNENPNTAPKIRLTPTSKLIASSNGSSDNKRRYVCTYENCTKSYGKSSHLRSHLTWHTGIKPFVCKEPGCGKGFTRSDELNRHIRTHTGEKPFECVQCTKKFSRSDHLTKHLATHTKQFASNNGAVMKKIKIEKNIPNNILKANCTVLPLTVNDIQYSKQINFNDTKVSQSQFNFAESVASRLKVVQEGSLKIKPEQSEVHHDTMIISPKQEIKSSSPSPMQQLESVEEFINIEAKSEPVDGTQAEVPNELDDDAIMPEANLPPLLENLAIIPAVGKVKGHSLLKTTTANHITDSVYDPTRPFPCRNCTKNFKRQDDLNRHMRTHTGEKPFLCNECDKRFMRSDHLKKHMKTHTRVR